MNEKWFLLSVTADSALTVKWEKDMLNAWLQALALGLALLFQWSWDFQVWIFTFLPTSGSARQEIPGGLNATCTWGNVQRSKDKFSY